MGAYDPNRLDSLDERFHNGLSPTIEPVNAISVFEFAQTILLKEVAGKWRVIFAQVQAIFHTAPPAFNRRNHYALHVFYNRPIYFPSPSISPSRFTENVYE